MLLGLPNSLQINAYFIQNFMLRRSACFDISLVLIVNILLCSLSNGRFCILVDESMVQQLMEMGFSKEGSQRAAYSTGSTSVENAMNWIVEHMADAGKNSLVEGLFCTALAVYAYA